MNLQIIKLIFEEYEGTITEENGKITISATNNLGGNKVRCEIEATENNFNACEKTYSIIGGVGYPTCEEKDLRKELEHFNFKKRKSIQMRLF